MLQRMNASEQPHHPEPARHAPLALWRAAGAFINILFQMFGSPEQIAESGALARTARDLLLSWLRAGEAFMRRLLLIEAAAYAGSLVPPRPRARRRVRRVRRVMQFSADKPEDWRVSFRMVERQSHGRKRSARAAGPRAAPRFCDAWPIAERCEALLRAYNDPTPFARRLAARLARRPALARAVFTMPAKAANLVGREDWAEADAQAHVAGRAFRLHALNTS
jgi:hypothetical protein